MSKLCSTTLSPSYACGRCPQTFTTSRARLRHVRETTCRDKNGGGVQKKIKCVKCSETFSREYDRRRHEHRKHSNDKQSNVLHGDAQRVQPRRGLREESHTVQVAITSPHPQRGDALIDPTDHTPSVTSPIEAGPSVQRHDDMALDTDSGVDTVKFSTLTLQNTGSLAQRRNPLDDKPVLCTICRSPFDTSNLQQLYSHLNDHFRDFNATDRCNECGINFVQKADLDRHRIAAATGDCGFKIHHTKPCTGHHPPGKDHLKVWDRLRHWEQCQLNAYIDQVEQLSSRRLGGSFVQTENNDACRGCRILDFYHRRFPEEYENIYSTHLNEHPRFEEGQAMQCCHPDMTKTATEQLLSRLTRRRQRRASYSDVSYSRKDSTPTLQREGDNVVQTSGSVAEPDPAEILDASYLSNPTQGLLHWAAGAGDSAAIKVLIAKGADMHGADMTGRTALHWSAASGSHEAVQLLLSHGANMELTDNAGQTPIFLGVECGNSAVVELLLEHGADPNVNDSMPQSCLHLAAQAGDATIIDQLLAHKAQVDNVDCFDRSPLHLAAKSGNLDAVLALCNAKASINLQDYAGRTPLFSAVENRNFEIARLFMLHHGASVTDRTVSKAIERGADEELLRLMRIRLSFADLKRDST